MKNTTFKYLVLSIIACLLPFLSIAQEVAPKVEMADKFYGEGKIYIVVTVLVTIFIGIVLYLVRLDKKITKLEKEIEIK